MKIIVLGDIHGNLPALEACFQQAETEGYDWLVHTGDVVGYGPFPDECVHFIHQRNIPGVQGNFDSGVASDADQSGAFEDDPKNRELADETMRWTRERMDLWTRRWLDGLPFELRRDAGRMRLAVFHASPIDLSSGLREDLPEPAWQEYGEASNADVIILGHTHRPFHRTFGGRHFVNAGSVGLPRDGNPQTGYAVIDIDGKMEVSFRRFPYDLDKAVSAVGERGLPPEIAARLQQGR
jgi:predicted phosphodiesterase